MPKPIRIVLESDAAYAERHDVWVDAVAEALTLGLVGEDMHDHVITKQREHHQRRAATFAAQSAAEQLQLERPDPWT